jgi:uncharacterized protein YdcH (DUF465 family)
MNIEKLKHHLSHLEGKHWKINKDIDLMERTGKYGDVDINQLKKERLHLKDEIAKITEQINELEKAL